MLQNLFHLIFEVMFFVTAEGQHFSGIFSFERPLEHHCLMIHYYRQYENIVMFCFVFYPAEGAGLYENSRYFTFSSILKPGNSNKILPAYGTAAIVLDKK